MIARKPPTRIAVLGGGFGGLYAASYLASADLAEGAIDVTLVSDTNHFTFTPLLSEVLGGALAGGDVTVPYRVLAHQRGFRFVRGRVEAVEPEAGCAWTTAGQVSFDYAVLALGGRPNFFGNEELERSALRFATVGDAVRIRHRVLETAERAEARGHLGARRLTFAVSGAGPAGVEAASEIRHLVCDVLPCYYDIGREARVILLDAGPRILRGWDERLALRGQEELRRMGVELRLSTRVAGFDGRVVSTTGPSGDSSFEADALVWTAGTLPATNQWGDSRLARDPSGHVSVEPTLSLRGLANVYAAGDLVRLPSPSTGVDYPPVAPIAISQGIRAAANIENAIAGRPPELYEGHHAGKILSLGNGVALADVLGFQIRGRPAWWLYRTAYLLKLVGTKNKVRAGTTLLLNRVFGRDLGLAATDLPEAVQGVRHARRVPATIAPPDRRSVKLQAPDPR